jgi:hypothetical protein
MFKDEGSFKGIWMPGTDVKKAAFDCRAGLAQTAITLCQYEI